MLERVEPKAAQSSLGRLLAGRYNGRAPQPSGGEVRPPAPREHLERVRLYARRAAAGRCVFTGEDHPPEELAAEPLHTLPPAARVRAVGVVARRIQGQRIARRLLSSAPTPRVAARRGGVSVEALEGWRSGEAPPSWRTVDRWWREAGTDWRLQGDPGELARLIRVTTGVDGAAAALEVETEGVRGWLERGVPGRMVARVRAVLQLLDSARMAQVEAA